jgi:hypothetical protein
MCVFVTFRPQVLVISRPSACSSGADPEQGVCLLRA